MRARAGGVRAGGLRVPHSGVGLPLHHCHPLALLGAGVWGVGVHPPPHPSQPASCTHTLLCTHVPACACAPPPTQPVFFNTTNLASKLNARAPGLAPLAAAAATWPQWAPARLHACLDTCHARLHHHCEVHTRSIAAGERIGWGGPACTALNAPHTPPFVRPPHRPRSLPAAPPTSLLLMPCPLRSCAHTHLPHCCCTAPSHGRTH